MKYEAIFIALLFIFTISGVIIALINNDFVIEKQFNFQIQSNKNELISNNKDAFDINKRLKEKEEELKKTEEERKKKLEDEIKKIIEEGYNKKEDEEKKKLRAKQEEDRKPTVLSPKNKNTKQTGNRSFYGAKEEPHAYDGGTIDLNTSFYTHAEALNSCFGYHYVHFQKAYKNLDNGYAVWFPRIAKRVGSQYLSSDQYWGWVNILSENGNTITQMDNPDYPSSGGEPDKNKRIIFARFEGDNMYRFVGVYIFKQRLSNGKSFTRIGTKLDTKTMKIIE